MTESRVLTSEELTQFWEEFQRNPKAFRDPRDYVEVDNPFRREIRLRRGVGESQT